MNGQHKSGAGKAKKKVKKKVKKARGKARADAGLFGNEGAA